jgi:epoxyqueuosine reductase
VVADLTQRVKEEALRLGFSLVGVTTCDLLPHAQVFEAWLADGKQGEMGYLGTPHSRFCRAYPARILPECRSVLVLGLCYPAPLPGMLVRSQDPPSLGRIAAYAWGEDYHEFLPGRLHSLVRFIEAQVGHPVPSRCYTDTGPILERELAQRAGLGWIGKNTCLINPRQGSYFLLAEILLAIELEPDPPFASDRCGTCTRCIQACPTHCILPDRTLDAPRCISYLTIELKGPIPYDLRPYMGRWVFGCDICQQVCPWNRFATSPADLALDQQRVLPLPDLAAELALTAAEFNRKYRHSPLKRAKRRGYLRNIAVVLGNLGLADSVSHLVRALLSDPEPLVRTHTAWALGQVGGEAANLALQQAQKTEQNPQVLLEIQNALR